MARTDNPLRLVMPTLAELPQYPKDQLPKGCRKGELQHFPSGGRVGPWKVGPWWNLTRSFRAGGSWSSLACSVYLNGGGTDDELRFLVHDYTMRHYPCQPCRGSGRIKRMGSPAHKGLLGSTIPAEIPDAGGKFECRTCNGSGKVNPQLGAANSFCYVDQPLRDHFTAAYHKRLMDRSFRSSGSLGSRGLSGPTKEDVLLIVHWADLQIDRIYRDACTACSGDGWRCERPANGHDVHAAGISRIDMDGLTLTGTPVAEHVWIGTTRWRETQNRVLSLAGEGEGVREICEQLKLHPDTVRRHIRGLKQEGLL